MFSAFEVRIHIVIGIQDMDIFSAYGMDILCEKCIVCGLSLCQIYRLQAGNRACILFKIEIIYKKIDTGELVLTG